MKFQKLAIALAVAGTFAVGTAQAQQQSPWYVGGGIGQSNYDFHNEWNDSTQTSRDDKDTGYKAFVGYRLSQRWGVELGYAKLGDFNSNYSDLNTKTEATSWTLAATGAFPINAQFSLLGRLGVARNTAEFSETEIPGGASASAKKTKTGLFWGLGAQYNYSQKIALRLDYDNYGKFGEAFVDDRITTGRAKADMWSLNVVVGF